MVKETCDECYKCYWYWLNNKNNENACFGHQLVCIDFKAIKTHKT